MTTPTTQHERFRELAALALYDELDGTEHATLEQHRASCADCRAFAAELELGLGRLARAPLADDLPLAWLGLLRARIEREAAPARAPRTRSGWLGFAAGLAAGLAASLLWMQGAGGPVGPSPDVAERVPDAPAPELVASTGFARATPPPRTTSQGPFAPLATLRRAR